ncbi:MAG: hypothetical protein JSS60_06895 [Verrucomicrobia bacterium]|nr:hypothetical protein [Verrucomicrobiota bacterium]
MSFPTNSATGQTSPVSPSSPVQKPEVPEFLQTAGKVTKFIFAALAAIVAVGSLGVGITIAPFSPETGAGAFALSTTLFALAGFLIYSGATSGPNLSSRNVTS